MRQPPVGEMQRVRERGGFIAEGGDRFLCRVPVNEPMIRTRRPDPEHGLLDGLWSCHYRLAFIL